MLSNPLGRAFLRNALVRAPLTFLLVMVLAAVAAAESPSPDIEVFTRTGCPHCVHAKEFLATLSKERPELLIVEHPVDVDQDSATRLRELSKAAGRPVAGLPTLIVHGQLLVGFDSPETTGRRIRDLLAARAAPAAATRTVDTSFGRVSVEELGMPLFTIVIGLLDGFNPCAMWVLLFLLSMLVNLENRKRMTLIAGTFVVTSGVVYFAFMAAWLNVFMLIGLSRGVQIGLGLVAAFVAIVNIKDFFFFKQGLSLSIPESAKPGIYQRVRNVLRQHSIGASLAGVVVLALAVNVVELLCTAGLPAVYTAILAEQDLSAAGHYAYLALYNVAYMFDDGVMVAIAIITLNKTRLTERGGRWLKLVSGAVMLLLALGLLFFPDALL